MSLCLFRSIEPKISINWKSYEKFFKNWFLVESNICSKSSLSFLSPYDSVKAKSQIFFFRFRPFFLQCFALPRPVRPLYPFFCILFHVSIHDFWVNFQTYAKSRFLIIQAKFSKIDQWVFVLGCYKLYLDGLIWSICGILRNWNF